MLKIKVLGCNKGELHTEGVLKVIMCYLLIVVNNIMGIFMINNFIKIKVQ